MIGTKTSLACQCSLCDIAHPRSMTSMVVTDGTPTTYVLMLPSEYATRIYKFEERRPEPEKMEIPVILKQTPRERANKNQPFYRKLKGRKERW